MRSQSFVCLQCESELYLPSHCRPCRNSPYRSEPQWSQNVGLLQLCTENRCGTLMLNLVPAPCSRKDTLLVKNPISTICSYISINCCLVSTNCSYISINCCLVSTNCSYISINRSYISINCSYISSNCLQKSTVYLLRSNSTGLQSMKIQYGKQSTFEVTFQAFKVYIRYKENCFQFSSYKYVSKLHIVLNSI